MKRNGGIACLVLAGALFFAQTPLKAGHAETAAVDVQAAAELLLHQTVLTVDAASCAQALSNCEMSLYSDLAAHAGVFSELTERIRSAVQDGSAKAAKQIESAGYPAPQVTCALETLTWQQVAAVCRTFGIEGVPKQIADTLLVTVRIAENTATLVVNAPGIDQMAAGGTRTQLMDAKFTLDYLNTVYDDTGITKYYEPYVFPDGYLQALIHPVPGGTIKDGWYAGRSANTRRHTGTDIIRSAKTEILSCTDGVVLYVGYLPIPGYYVVIRDPLGFEYHYYHMYEESAFVSEGDPVKQGDVIGRVGSTGNSAGYHLHLTVVSPENTYINPYDMFQEAGIGTMRG